MRAAGARIIGLDFDNTIVSYENVYRELAKAYGVDLTSAGSAKNLLRDHLKKQGREEEFTTLQGEVYGPGMRQAKPYPGFIDFLKETSRRGWGVKVISHRTRRPLAGTAHDLHQAARDWMAGLGLEALGLREAYFEETKEAKLKKIGICGCCLFVDDLPEILKHPNFPTECARFLFSPDLTSPCSGDGLPRGGWREVQAWLEAHES